MSGTQFVVLVARRENGVSVYGPFTDRSDAHWIADWYVTMASDAFAASTLALFPPRKRLSVPTVSAGEVILWPEAVASALEEHTVEATSTDILRVVCVVVLTSPRIALVAGPFDEVEELDWIDSAGSTRSTMSARCYVLPLQDPEFMRSPDGDEQQ